MKPTPLVLLLALQACLAANRQLQQLQPCSLGEAATTLHKDPGVMTLQSGDQHQANSIENDARSYVDKTLNLHLCCLVRSGRRRQLDARCVPNALEFDVYDLSRLNTNNGSTRNGILVPEGLTMWIVRWGMRVRMRNFTS